MRKFCLFFLLIFPVLFRSDGQILNEWVNQKSTQTNYLIQQIAALQVYIGYLNKGYQIARKGLITISDIKHGHLDIDKLHFLSLEVINPNITSSKKTIHIATLYEAIKNHYKMSLKKLANCKVYSDGEINYLKKVLDNNAMACEDLIKTLHVLVSTGKLKMPDDKRMQNISGIYDEMLDRYAFQKSFSNDIVIVCLQRTKEIIETKSAENFYR